MIDEDRNTRRKSLKENIAPGANKARIPNKTTLLLLY